MLAATLYWYQAAATPPTDSKAASAAAMRVNARPPPKPPISAITADHQVNQALHDAPGAGRHVEDVLGDEGHADRAEAE